MLRFFSLPALLIVCSSFAILNSSAQVDKSLTQKLNLYTTLFPEESVFLHLSGINFKQGDKIWFNAFISDELGKQAKGSGNLYISLVDADSLEVMNNKFDFTGSRVQGNFQLPVSLQPGKYMLVAYTGRMKNLPCDRYFSTLINITSPGRDLNVSITASDTICDKNIALPFYIVATDKKNLPVSASFTYMLNGLATPVTGKGKTDKQGKATLSLMIPSGAKNPTLHVVFPHSQQYSLVIPTSENILEVAFYPEGGMMFYGVPVKLAFRGYRSNGSFADFKGEIYNSENQLVKRIESSFRGIGSCMLTPEKGQSYYLKITYPSGIAHAFILPRVYRSGTSFTVFEKTKDKLTFSLTSVNHIPSVYHVIGHVKGNIFWRGSFGITKNYKLDIPLDEFPEGIAEFAVFDSTMNLVAKRLVYVNEGKNPKMIATADQQAYLPRSKVTLNVEVKNASGAPVHGIFSVGAELTQESQEEFSTFSELNADLVGDVQVPAGLFRENEEDAEILDNNLIANACKRFIWTDVLLTDINTSGYNSRSGNSLDMDIQAEKQRTAWFAQKIEKESRTPGLSFGEMQKNDMEKILHPKVVKEKNAYDSNKDIMDLIFEKKPYKMVDGKIVFISNGPNTLIFQQGAGIVLDGVYMGTDPSCLAHIPRMDIDKVFVSTNPNDVSRYTGLNSIGIIEVYTRSAMRLKNERFGTGPAAEADIDPDAFPGPDYSILPKKGPKDLRSVLYWMPSVRTDENGKALITFYNGDIPGKVIISLNGITDEGTPVSATLTYNISR